MQTSFAVNTSHTASSRDEPVTAINITYVHHVCVLGDSAMGRFMEVSNFHAISTKTGLKLIGLTTKWRRGLCNGRQEYTESSARKGEARGRLGQAPIGMPVIRQQTCWRHELQALSVSSRSIRQLSTAIMYQVQYTVIPNNEPNHIIPPIWRV
jgi:hypothetical protein